ncbi:nucleotidyltransferase domain-containing protein [Pararhodonellum marinum]|uniref:nucleotidyltransferase domain-containing protein n=1 Tax=Pararhodonellum marinum TaxID=2755358 RepID=UPI00188FE85E|nr:nucleotidyltransferase domain-containing protein [Pararhodonellum marinum]
MEEKIKKYLSDLEKEKGIEILLACETGSRAWGFPSPDSDFDVRVIYKHDKDWYLSLIEEKDTIEYFLENNEIDIGGWDLRKSLRLLAKSNPPLLERIQSPIIYKVDKEFLTGINLIAKKTYSRIATIHHYLSMAKKSFEEVTNSDEYKLKKLFYALRASVACSWILEKEEIPPIEFGKMLNGLDLAVNLKTRIGELIEIKSTISETYLHKGETLLIEFMKTCIQRAENESQSLPPSKGKMTDLNDFFLKTLA